MNILKNMSLLKRLYISLAVFVFIPLVLVGLVAYFFVGTLSRESSYKDEIELFESSVGDIESSLIITEELQTSSVIEGSISRLLSGSATNRDYLELSSYLEELIVRYSLYKNITLSMGGEVVFQRGVHITHEIEQYIELTLNAGEYWAPPHSMNTAATNSNGYSGEVISYYSEIYDYFNNVNNTVGVMAINIDEQMLYDTYTTYVNSLSNYSAIVKADGTILSSGNKSELGQKSDLFEKIKPEITTTSGYILLNNLETPSICYYYTGEETQFTFINLVPLSAYAEIENSFAFVLSIAIAACLLFGIGFSIIQRRYVVNPILKIRNDLNKVKQGIFNLEPAHESSDEIGQLALSISDMSHSLDSLINENYLRKIKQQEAEINAMVMQINPHFLYNTLDSIHWSAVSEGAYDTSEQIVALSSIFRHALNKGDEFVTVQNELDFLENYMFIMKRRYGKRVDLTLDVDEESKRMSIPKLLIQPLIENAILHGIEPQKEGGTISLSVKLGKNLVIEVTDTGIGVDEQTVIDELKIKDGTRAFALKNINERLKLLYGEENGIVFHSKSGVGTEVTITIPTQSYSSQNTAGLR